MMKQRRLATPLYFVYLAGALVALLAVYFWLSPVGEGAPRRESSQFAVLPPKAVPTPQPIRRSPQGPGRTRVGIVAGHAGFDSGAVCPDGLTEASINLEVAQMVVARLAAQGILTDLLDEFDPRQHNYVASAIVSIHADSCIYPEATGFKVASLEGSTNPENQLLVDCLTQEYGRQTGLPFHANSITYDMTQYHVFDSIDPQTAGAIIEVGFMLADRDLLVNHAEDVAQGIVDGILCFLQARRELR